MRFNYILVLPVLVACSTLYILLHLFICLQMTEKVFNSTWVRNLDVETESPTEGIVTG